MFFPLLFRRCAVRTTSTAVLRATPATCRQEHARRSTTARSSAPSLWAKWHGPSREAQRTTRTYHVTARGSFTAPSKTHAASCQPQSGPAAPHPGYVHTPVSHSNSSYYLIFLFETWFHLSIIVTEFEKSRVLSSSCGAWIMWPVNIMSHDPQKLWSQLYKRSCFLPCWTGSFPRGPIYCFILCRYSFMYLNITVREQCVPHSAAAAQIWFYLTPSWNKYNRWNIQQKMEMMIQGYFYPLFTNHKTLLFF